MQKCRVEFTGVESNKVKRQAKTQSSRLTDKLSLVAKIKAQNFPNTSKEGEVA